MSLPPQLGLETVCALRGRRVWSALRVRDMHQLLPSMLHVQYINTQLEQPVCMM